MPLVPEQRREARRPSRSAAGTASRSVPSRPTRAADSQVADQPVVLDEPAARHVHIFTPSPPRPRRPPRVIRAPKRISAGCDAILPATSASPWRNVVARSIRPGGTNEKTPPDVAEVGGRVHPHQDEVVALREHVLVHLLRPLRHDDQVEAELAPLARDPDRVLGGERRERVAPARRGRRCAPRRSRSRPARARARRRQSRSSTCPAAIACSSRVGERAEVDDEAARPVRVLELVRRATSPSGPGQMPQRSTPRLRARSLSASDCTRCDVGQAADALVLEQRGQLRVLLAVGERVEPQQRRLLLRAELAEAHADRRRRRSTPLRTATEPATGREALRPRSRRRSARGSPEPDVVRVRVEHDDPQARLHQELLEQHAERVGLAGAGLAAQEGVPAEARRRRARTARPARAPARRPSSEARSGCVRSSQAATSSGRAGRTVASWNGRPSPSSTAPSPRPTRIRTCGRPGPVASSLPNSSESTCPSRSPPSPSSTT